MIKEAIKELKEFNSIISDLRSSEIPLSEIMDFAESLPYNGIVDNIKHDVSVIKNFIDNEYIIYDNASIVSETTSSNDVVTEKSEITTEPNVQEKKQIHCTISINDILEMYSILAENDGKTFTFVRTLLCDKFPKYPKQTITNMLSKKTYKKQSDSVFKFDGVFLRIINKKENVNESDSDEIDKLIKDNDGDITKIIDTEKMDRDRIYNIAKRRYEMFAIDHVYLSIGLLVSDILLMDQLVSHNSFSVTQHVTEMKRKYNITVSKDLIKSIKGYRRHGDIFRVFNA